MPATRTHKRNSELTPGSNRRSPSRRVVVRGKHSSRDFHKNLYANHDRSLTERFNEFRRANPDIEAWLAERALELKRRGRQRYGIQGLIEVLRWEEAMQTNDPNATLKINNDFAALYARLLMRKHRALRGFFELRKRTAR